MQRAPLKHFVRKENDFSPVEMSSNQKMSRNQITYCSIPSDFSKESKVEFLGYGGCFVFYLSSLLSFLFLLLPSSSCPSSYNRERHTAICFAVVLLSGAMFWAGEVFLVHLLLWSRSGLNNGHDLRYNQNCNTEYGWVLSKQIRYLHPKDPCHN